MKKTILLCLFIASSLCYGQALTIDPAFNGVTTGVAVGYYIEETVLQPDGKILAGGYFSQYNGATASCIARLNTDGSLDTTFTTGTGFLYQGYTGRIDVIKVLADGKILVAGLFTSYNGADKSGLVRLNANGSLDNTFTSLSFNTEDPAISNILYDIKVNADGKIYIAGDFKLSNGAVGIARLNADGTVDATFGLTGIPYIPSILSLAIQDNGKVVAGGNFNATAYTSGIARFNTDGSLDMDFINNTEIAGVIYDVFIQPDGKLLFSGLLSFSMNAAEGYYLMARANTDGTTDDSFTPVYAQFPDTGANRFSSIQLYMDKLLVSGWGLSYLPGATSGQLLLLNMDGSVDSGFTTGTSFGNAAFDSGILSVAVQPDNKIIPVGFFDSYNGTTVFGITKLGVFNLGLTKTNHKQNDIIAFNSNGFLSLVSYNGDIKSVAIYDITGRLLLNENNIFSREFKTDNIANNQVLICNIALANNKTVFVQTHY